MPSARLHMKPPTVNAHRQFFTDGEEGEERLTILLRYFKCLTQEQTARVVGVSQVQVSRLERRGLQRLRESFAP